jgi:hypothetical protein
VGETQVTDAGFYGFRLRLHARQHDDNAQDGG